MERYRSRPRYPSDDEGLRLERYRSRPWCPSDDEGPSFTSSRWKTYLKKYKNISEQELILISDCTFDKKNFEYVANVFNSRSPKEKRAIRGIDSYNLQERKYPIRRRDGSFIVGLTFSRWKAYLKRYKNVSEQELIAIRDSTYDSRSFECLATILNLRRLTENRDFMDTDDDDGDDDLYTSHLPLPHGSKIVALTPSKWRAYLKKYKNVPKQDLIAIRDTCIHFHRDLFEFKAGKLDREKAPPSSSSSGDGITYSFGRIDGRFLTSSEWHTYLKKYRHVSELELAEIRDSIDHPVYYKSLFESRAEDLNLEKKLVKSDGLRSTLAIPLFMLFSVQVKPRGENKPFSVYGEITTRHKPPVYDRDYLYKRNFDEVEKFGSDGGNLTLNGPSPSCPSEVLSYTLQSRKLSIKLYDETQRTLADGCVDLSYSQDEFEEFKETVVDIGELSLTFKYLSIPMAIYGRVEFSIFNKVYTERVNLLESVNVCGKVVATYKNTFGDYDSQEIVLFDKNANKNEYEKVVIGSIMNLLFPRCWVAVPVSSLLHLHIDLFEFQTNKTILKEDVDLDTHRDYGYYKRILTADFFISVSASWFNPSLLGRSEDADATSGQGESKDADDSAQGEFKDADDSAQGESKDADATSGQGESKDADDSAQGESKDADDTAQGESKDADDSAQGESMDGGGDCVQISRILEPCAELKKFPAVEVFSVLICDKMCMTSKIHGLLQILYNSRKIDILKKDDEDPLSLSGRGNTIPVLDDPRLYPVFDPFSVICDLKGTLIKGHQNVDYDRILPRNKQLCSIFRGDHGFAALHYAIFPSAVRATLNVRYTKNGLKCVGTPVLGSFYAQYNGFNYSCEYEKKCYRIVLFKRRTEKEDSVSVDKNGLIPLSRYSMVIPSNFSFMFDVHFIIGTREFYRQKNIKIGTSSMSIKSDECEVEIDLEWSEAK